MARCIRWCLNDILAYIGLTQLRLTLQRQLILKTMPRGILGSLVVAIVLFVAVALVLVGMFHYSNMLVTLNL